MLENITTILGGVVLFLGLLVIAATWARSKSATVARSMDAVTSRLTDAIDGNKRMDALRDAEELYQYFEGERNSAGQDAVKQAVGELFSKGNKS
jgi:hypothetical protein